MYTPYWNSTAYQSVLFFNFQNFFKFFVIYTFYTAPVVRLGEKRGVYRVLVGKPEGKRPLGRPRPRWENNIKMDLQVVRCGGHGLDRASSGQGQLLGTGKCRNVPSGSIKFEDFLDQLKTLQLFQKDSAARSITFITSCVFIQSTKNSCVVFDILQCIIVVYRVRSRSQLQLYIFTEVLKLIVE